MHWRFSLSILLLMWNPVFCVTYVPCLAGVRYSEVMFSTDDCGWNIIKVGDVSAPA